MSNYILGIDIGGTTAKLGLFSEEHFPEIIVKRSVKTRPDEGGKYILPDIAEGIKQLFEDEGIDKSQIDGIGVGVPGPVITGDKPGQTLVNKCVNLGWGVKDVAAELSELTGIEKVVVENDANAAALGEIICGSVRDMAEKIGTYRKVTEVLVTIGTGIGGGIVRDGQIIRGYFGCAGEIGHIKIAPQHPLLAKLREAGADINTFDDFEYFASATGIIRFAREGAKFFESSLRDCENMGAREVFEAARAGDKLALEVRDFFYDTFGMGIAAVASTLDPDVFTIGGGVSGEGPVLLGGIRESYRRYAFHASTETEFRLAALGNDAGMIGAAVPFYM